MSKFEISYPPPDFVNVAVDGKFSVRIIRDSDYELRIEVYPEGWDSPIETMTVRDDGVATAEAEAA